MPALNHPFAIKFQLKRVAFLLAVSIAVCFAASCSRPTMGSLVGPELASLIAPGAKLEMVATGFEFVEGPVWHPDGYLLFVDLPQFRIMKWDPNRGISIHREPTNASNGLAVDGEGNIIACETGPPARISRTGPDGKPEPLATNYQGNSLNSPNDLTVGADGSIYFTDPVFSELHKRRGQIIGVYRISPQRELTLLAHDFAHPNGIALSPDQKTLYVNDSARMYVRAFDLTPDGNVVNDRVFAELRPWAAGVIGVPDGMKVDSDGNLYATGPGGIWVFNPRGERLGVIVMPESPSNCAFGDEDMKTLYITGTVSLFRIRLSVAGPTHLGL
jgi:sugar lactone lactonase YvrE